MFSSSDVARTAALLERQELLTTEVQYLDAASYRRRCAIEEELDEIHRQLEKLWSKEHNWSLSQPGRPE